MRLAALILAAGRSRRFGADNKLLASLGGDAVIRRTVAAVRGAGLDTIVAVTGPDGDAIEAALADFSVRCVRCADDRDGLGYSIATGAGALDADSNGVMIVPADMPLLSSASLRMLISVFGAQGGRRIVHAADANGVQRNPVIWPRAMFENLGALHGSDGAKALIRDAIAVRIPERELVDIDDAADFAQAQQAVDGNRSHS
jgi:molybdenum cofactor cytidylyltransferase